MFFVFDTIFDQYKTQKICDKFVSLYPFFNSNCPNKYKTQIMCNETVDDPLVVLKLIPNWFVTTKMIKKLFYCFVRKWWFTLFFEDSGDVTFFCNEMGILSVNSNYINLDNNFDEDDPGVNIRIRFLGWHSKCST